MTKRFVMFSSLLAVVAMFLGLMVTGCSDKDRDNYNPDEPVEGTTVQISFEQAEPKAPAEATEYQVQITDGEHAAYDNTFVAGGEGYQKEGNIVTLTCALEQKDVEFLKGKGNVIVNVFDEEADYLGVFLAAAHPINEGVNEVNFVDDQDGKYFDKATDLDCKHVVADGTGEIEIVAGDEPTVVMVESIYSTKEGNVVVRRETVQDFTMAEDSGVGNLVFDQDKHTVVADTTKEDVVGSKNDVTITLTQSQDTVAVMVNVVGAKASIAYASEDLKPAAGDKVSVDYSIDGAPQGTKDLGDDNVVCEDVVGAKVAVTGIVLTMADGTVKSAVYEPTNEQELVKDGVVFTVTKWDEPQAEATLLLECTGEAALQDGDSVVVKYTVNGGTGKDAQIDMNNNLITDECVKGEKVTIQAVELTRGVETLDGLEGSAVDVTLEEGVNVFEITQWHERG